jgi:hypothetical protein
MHRWWRRRVLVASSRSIRGVVRPFLTNGVHFDKGIIVSFGQDLVGLLIKESVVSGFLRI